MVVAAAARRRQDLAGGQPAVCSKRSPASGLPRRWTGPRAGCAFDTVGRKLARPRPAACSPRPPERASRHGHRHRSPGADRPGARAREPDLTDDAQVASWSPAEHSSRSCAAVCRSGCARRPPSGAPPQGPAAERPASRFLRSSPRLSPRTSTTTAAAGENAGMTDELYAVGWRVPGQTPRWVWAVFPSLADAVRVARGYARLDGGGRWRVYGTRLVAAAGSVREVRDRVLAEGVEETARRARRPDRPIARRRLLNHGFQDPRAFLARSATETSSSRPARTPAPTSRPPAEHPPQRTWPRSPLRFAGSHRRRTTAPPPG